MIEESVHEVAEEYGEIAKIVPYGKQLIKAYRWTKTHRIKRFLRSLDLATEEITEKRKRKFNKYIESEEGKELLSEYTDTVLRTSSKTATAALAILYADVDDEEYTKEFKVSACLGLMGITETLIDIFAELINVSMQSPPISDGPYSVYSFKPPVLTLNPVLRRLISNPGMGINAIQDLIGRGLLLPDHIATRIVGEGWQCYYGVSQETFRFYKLLQRAQGYIEQSQ
jgi:hypothetical protein